MGQGLGAIAENIKKRKEAQEAAAGGASTPVPETAKRKAAVDGFAPGTAVAKPKPVQQMPKSELDTLRDAEQKKFEERRKKAAAGVVGQ